MSRYPSMLPPEPSAVSHPLSSCVQTFALSWLLLPLHILLRPTSLPKDTFSHSVALLSPSPAPLTCIFLAVPSMNVALAASELWAPGWRPLLCP